MSNQVMKRKEGHCIAVEIFTQFSFPFSQLTFLFILSGSVGVLNLMQIIEWAYKILVFGAIAFGCGILVLSTWSIL